MKYVTVTNGDRARIVNAVNNLQLSLAQTSEVFKVPYATVARICREFKQRGTTDVKVKGGPLNVKVSDEARLLIKEMIDADCGITLKQIQNRLQSILNIKVGLSTIYNQVKTLKRPGRKSRAVHRLSYKKYPKLETHITGDSLVPLTNETDSYGQLFYRKSLNSRIRFIEGAVTSMNIPCQATTMASGDGNYLGPGIGTTLIPKDDPESFYPKFELTMTVEQSSGSFNPEIEIIGDCSETKSPIIINDPINVTPNAPESPNPEIKTPIIPVESTNPEMDTAIIDDIPKSPKPEMETISDDPEFETLIASNDMPKSEMETISDDEIPEISITIPNESKLNPEIGTMETQVILELLKN